MSQQGVEGLRAERADTLVILRSLSDDEWNAPSGCEGWAVRDVVAHMGSILHGVVDPSLMPDVSSGTEAAMEGPVAERRAWTTAEVLDEYETYSGQLDAVVVMAQDPPMSETVLPLGDLGTHPMSIFASMFCFDNYCHLRHDILGPRGPIDRAEPPRDDAARRRHRRVDARGTAVDVAVDAARARPTRRAGAHRSGRRHVDDRARR